MSTSRGRALRTVLAAACALLTLAALAGPASAALTAAATGAPARLIVLNGTLSGNTYTVDTRGSLRITLNVGGSSFDADLNPFPEALERSFCSHPAFAGAYVSVGAILALPWRPSEEAGAETRSSGPTKWANITAAASVPGREGCRTPVTIPDQTLLGSRTNAFLTTIDLAFCQERGGNFVLTGQAAGSGGGVVTYLIPSTNNVWHLFSQAALGTISEDLEQIVNVRVNGLPNPSTACTSI